ncbi:MAG: 30S ribosomal protein S2 [Candidatus Pacearchaeota archaeon]
MARKKSEIINEKNNETAGEITVPEEKKKKGRKKKDTDEEKSPAKKEKTSDRSVLLREIKEKAKKFAESIETVKTEDIKEELEKKRELLIPLEDYVKTGIHLGTKVITPDMKEFVYRRRADSIGVLNTTLIDEHIKKAISLISKYSPEEIVLICKREAGWEPAEKFSKVTGIKSFTKKYPAGMMTNTELSTFYEPELVIICDPWVDRNALAEAILTNKKVIMLCDTNNFTKGANVRIPCNNKSSKSLGLIFYLLANGYIEKNKLEKAAPSMEDFVGDDGQEA